MAVISSVGTFAADGNTAITTLAYTTVNIGDLVAFSVMVNSTSIHATAVSSTRASSWQRVAGFTAGSSVPSTFEIWTGIVSSAGSDTATVTWSAAVTGIFVEFDIAQFTSTLGSSTVWGTDGSGFLESASSNTRSYPTLTPTGTNRCYFGHNSSNAGSSSSGSTSGYTYQNPVASGDQTIYNPNVPNSAQSPTGLNGGTASQNSAIAVLFTASAATASLPRRPLVLSQSVARASSF